MEATHEASSPIVARAPRTAARTAPRPAQDEGLGWVMVIPITLVAMLAITMYLSSIAR